MRTIIAGGREIDDYQLVLDAIAQSGFEISTVISGGARGVDALGEQYANDSGLALEIYPAEWNKHGRSAGPIRNGKMAEVADALIAVWDGKSTGTKNMIEQATRRGLHVHIAMIDDVQQELDVE